MLTHEVLSKYILAAKITINNSYSKIFQKNLLKVKFFFINELFLSTKSTIRSEMNHLKDGKKLSSNVLN